MQKESSTTADPTFPQCHVGWGIFIGGGVPWSGSSVTRDGGRRAKFSLHLKRPECLAVVFILHVFSYSSSAGSYIDKMSRQARFFCADYKYTGGQYDVLMPTLVVWCKWSHTYARRRYKREIVSVVSHQLTSGNYTRTCPPLYNYIYSLQHGAHRFDCYYRA